MIDKTRKSVADKDKRQEKTREEVFKLLKKGTSSKLLGESTQKARQYLQEAYDIARTDKLAPFWKALTAYRLGHIIMRAPQDKDDLLDAEEHFLQAARIESLGPMPGIYHLAVLHRLEVVPKLLKKALVKAIERVTLYTSLAEERKGDFTLPELQDCTFNMLELAVYFTGQDYHQLEGLGKLLPNADPFFDLYPYYSPWILQSNQRLVSGIRYPKFLALEELDERVKIEPYDLIFRITANRGLSQWRTEYGDWVTVGHKSLLYLVAALAGCSSREKFRKILSGDHTEPVTEDTFRRRKKNLLDKLEPLLQSKKIGRDDIFQIDQSWAEEIPYLNPKISVLGAIEASIIDT